MEQSHRGRFIIISIVTVVLIATAVTIGLSLLLKPTRIQSSIRTYFTYSQSDIDSLSKLSSRTVMSIDEVEKWENRTYELVEDHGDGDVDASKIYAYLAVAQMDAAALSLEASGSFTGNIGLISKDVLCELYQDSCGELIATEDPYSKKISDMVVSQVKNRIVEDTAQTTPNTLRSGSQYWQGPSPQVGLSAPSFKPWFMTKGDQFRVAPPLDISTPAMQAEIATVKASLAAATNEQKAVVVKWAGGPGTRTPPGIWLTLATDYMHAEDTPFDAYLEIRALVTASMADAVIGAFDSKYAHQYKRPNLVDTSIVTIMPTPNHPSYPAGHATISWAAATVLSKYLPGNQQEWERLAVEASDSRTVGGIHFPSDNKAGTTLGTSIGNQVLSEWEQ
jgi:membrane-associated phospholipid phosphatase